MRNDTKIRQKNCNNISITFDQQVHTNRTIPFHFHNKDLSQKSEIIDVTIPMDVALNKEETKKFLKYQNLAIQISRMSVTQVGAVGN